MLNEQIANRQSIEARAAVQYILYYVAEVAIRAMPARREQYLLSSNRKSCVHNANTYCSKLGACHELYHG